MIEVTEADKRAAQNAFDSVAWGCPDSEMRCFVQAFAAHRIEAAKAERDRIVAWLRDKADDHKPFGTTQGDPTGCVLSLAACAIEESQP